MFIIFCLILSQSAAYTFLPTLLRNTQSNWKTSHGVICSLRQKHYHHISSCSCALARNNDDRFRMIPKKIYPLIDIRFKLSSSSRNHELIRKTSHVKNKSTILSLSTVSCKDVQTDENENIKVLKSSYSAIKKGEIFVKHDFLDPSEISLLRKDISQLKDLSLSSIDKSCGSYFKPSGLSNRFPGDKNYFGLSDRLTCTITPDLIRGNEKYANMRSVVERKMEMLRSELEVALTDFRSKNDNALELKLEEMYYSISPTGSHLPRHSDERHEDTKGEKGWMNETRRSISWLIYLNYNDNSNKNIGHHPWKSSNGGQLRAYCRKSRGSDDNTHVPCGSHQGNIQVGWLKQQKFKAKKTISNTESPQITTNGNHCIIEFEPVFLDSWIQTPVVSKENPNQNMNDDNNLSDEHDEGFDDSRLKWKPMAALYRVNNNKNVDNVRDYLSEPFGSQSPSWPSDTNLEPAVFSQALASQISSDDHRERFIGVEDIHVMNDQSMMQTVDIIPSGGTLVLFDSVAVPHEVLEVRYGDRLAIAGWFHERQQEFPDWYGT